MLDSAQRLPAMICHLLVPHLAAPAASGAEPSGRIELPALETLMARGKRTRFDGASIERWLAAAFRVDSGGTLALAPFALRGEGYDPGTHGWLCADPVHLRIEAGRAVLTDASRFAIPANDAQELVDALNAHFGARGLSFLAPVPERWYVRVATAPRLRAIPTADASGKDITPHLPTGDDQAYWRGVLNEAQMLLHAHPCNERREQSGDVAVNSLWLWGAGVETRPEPSPRYHTVWSDHPLAKGLGLSSGIETRSLPAAGADFLRDAARAGGPGDALHLLVLPPPQDAARAGPDAWRDALVRIEGDWFAPLLTGMLEGAVSAVTLVAVGAFGGWSAAFTRGDRLKFWRRRKRIADYIT
jgi:hypothetical protein